MGRVNMIHGHLDRDLAAGAKGLLDPPENARVIPAPLDGGVGENQIVGVGRTPVLNITGSEVQSVAREVPGFLEHLFG